MNGPEPGRRGSQLVCILALILAPSFLWAGEAENSIQAAARRARDLQDRTALEAIAAHASVAAGQEPQNAASQYDSALVHSYLAEVFTEIHEQAQARKAAEAGIPLAEKAVSLQPGVSEYHRLLGALYAQVIPGNLAMGLRYGHRTLEEIDRAIALDPKNADAYLSRGVGKYYLPAAFGGGTDAALEDIHKSIELNPKSDQAYLWLGIVLRKANRNLEARQALSQSLQLNPQRAWAKTQLEKTPAP